jgi:glycine/sarcosine/betaine reductase complex component A
VYHAVEPEFKEAVNPDVYDEQIGMMEMVLDVDGIIEEMNSIRDEFSTKQIRDVDKRG